MHHVMQATRGAGDSERVALVGCLVIVSPLWCGSPSLRGLNRRGLIIETEAGFDSAGCFEPSFRVQYEFEGDLTVMRDAGCGGTVCIRSTKQSKSHQGRPSLPRLNVCVKAENRGRG